MKLKIDYRNKNNYYFRNKKGNDKVCTIYDVLEFKHNWVNEITILLR